MNSKTVKEEEGNAATRSRMIGWNRIRCLRQGADLAGNWEWEYQQGSQGDRKRPRRARGIQWGRG
eukprot:765374-Hanusia_phi.AAC.5